MKKRINALNLKTLDIDVIEYKTIYDFPKREYYIEYLYDICILNEDLFQKYLIEYRDNNNNEELSKEDMEMLFAIKSVRDIVNNFKSIQQERLSNN